ncbi:uncharacterized protein MAM_06815 [Metarhizium album ARSEF 1941]|uniref:DUF1746 domain-containing protein n=1 Tax=Metarhizium album (strain ARSEF 1941) TaxID=1081103 RepID=A0A0B2WH45_METAS|nr:uncharacterized protein MAM_06815 [Metarhizium album ARSEF 1941]KHN95311.1 hypothetical protein MAM_06815 [Metarhizium album ARSEF 1941]
MNHDATSGSPAPAPENPSPRQIEPYDTVPAPAAPDVDPEPADADADADAEADGDVDANGWSQSRSRSRSRRRRRRKGKKDRNPGLVKKLSFVTHLLQTLDLLVFAELSGLYYMECSMFRFLLRAVGQYMYLTPKDEAFPFLMPASRIHVLLVVIPNFTCIFLHLFASLPRGPDFHRGYQHRGLVIDFVGQRPPTNRLYYVLADLTILVVQCLMLTVHTQREQLRVVLKTFRPILPEVAEELEAGVRSIQDLDAEERGLSPRTPSGTAAAAAVAASGTRADDGGAIEMCDASASHQTGEASEQTGESVTLLRESTSECSSRAQLADIMDSGNAVVGEYYIVQSVLSAAGDLERSAAHSLRSLSYGATLATLRARRRAVMAQSATIRPDR